jgi:uncharacterized 2Fe-2S/4Fe-4S cluster protein (DUF4445 family)
MQTMIRGGFVAFLVEKIVLPRVLPDDPRALDQRLREATGSEVSIPLVLLRSMSVLSKSVVSISCVLCRTDKGKRLVAVGVDKSFSVALDLGSTNLVASLFDNLSGKTLLTKSIENPQIAFGSDVLTRMQHAMSGRANEVSQALITGVNALITQVCKDAGIVSAEIHAMSIAGNTVMTHFFLGLDVSGIPVAPYAPVVRQPGFFTARELSLAVNPDAQVFVFPNAGSYVGGDITAGILASGLAYNAGTSILIDVGTNAEIVIGNSEWMIVGAGAAGPALEEGIVRIGKRAKKGIVYDFAISGDDVSCRTFDQAEPEGICGSGMVSLLYELHRAGIVDQAGTLVPGPHVREVEGERAFFLNCSAESPLYVTQSELANFIKSKAAMFTLLLTLTRAVGVSFAEIERVFVSGALGTGIDPVKAVGIGMLPSWHADRIRPLGNSSLAGALLLLQNGEMLEEVKSIADRITYKHMHDDPVFMREFLGAVFLPHTQPDLLKA